MEPCRYCYSVRLQKNLGVYATEEGKLMPCPHCAGELFKASWASRYGAEAGLLPAMQAVTLKQMDTSYHPTAKAMVEACAEVLRGNLYWLTLTGAPYAGKTHALSAVVGAACAGRGLFLPVQARYYTAATLLDYLREGYGQGDFDLRYRTLLHLPLLAIDEMDKVKGLLSGEATWVQEKLGALIDYRWQLALSQQAATLVAMNSDPDVLPEYLARRVAGPHATVLAVTARDWR